MTGDAASEPSSIGATGVPTRGSRREPDDVRAVLEHWLRASLPGATEVTVTGVETPEATGVANETILCTARLAGDGGEREQGYVVRVAPGDFLYKDVDLSVHAGMYQALANVPGVPVPAVVGYEADASLLGAPFFVMERIDGRVPPDTPPFHTEGWVADLSTAERDRMWREAVAVLARLHESDPSRFPFLARPHLGPTGLEQEMAYWFDYERWALAGRHEPVIEGGRRWLVDNLPDRRPTELSWGDSRVGNMMFRDGKVVAVFDWDMVSLAGAQCDLAWWTIMDLLQTASAGVERLPGIGSPGDTVRLWQQYTGRDVPDLWWYLVFNAYRMSVILVRLGFLLDRAGALPPEHVDELSNNNPGMQYLASMLGLPHARPLSQPWPGIDYDL